MGFYQRSCEHNFQGHVTNEIAREHINLRTCVTNTLTVKSLKCYGHFQRME